MLGSIATILKSAFEICLIITLILISFHKARLKNFIKYVWLGVSGAIVVALSVVYQFNFFGNQEIFEGFLSLIIPIVAVIFWFWSWLRLQRSGITQGGGRTWSTGFFVVTTTMFLVLPKTIEIALFPQRVFIMSTSIINTEMVLKVSGAFIGLLMAVFFGWFFLHTEKRISSKMFLTFSGVALLVVIFRQLIMGLQLLFATGVLPLTTWSVSLIAPLINSYYPMFFYSLIGLAVILWGMVRHRLNSSPPNTSAAHNPAQKRKITAAFRREIKWMNALGLSLLTVVLVLAGSAVMNRNKAKIEPPIPVTARDNKIIIPLKDVNDGKLHRYSYVTPAGIETRFIVIRKGEKIYGTGLDACEICGKAGYYQRGKDVICKNCDVVINIPTIGFPGGCNPMPIKNVVNGSTLEIDTANLKDKEDVFKD